MRGFSASETQWHLAQSARFQNSDRDSHANQRVGMTTENQEEFELKKGLGKPKTLATQMRSPSVGETKSSIFDSFRLMAALPADLREKFNTLQADEAAAPTKNGQPNIFHSQERDRHANQRINTGAGKTDEDALKRNILDK